jgi:hypothetical protein
MARFSTVFFTLFIPLVLWAQEPEYLEFVKAEKRLQTLFNQLYSDSLSDKESFLDTLQKEMPLVLGKIGSMDFPWKGLDKIGIISSEDEKIRVFTWHIADDMDHFRYFGFIQVAMKKGKTRVFKLSDNGKPQRGLLKYDQSIEDWCGKLYYQVLTNEYKRKTYYTLLGMDFNNSRSNIKSVEVIALQRGNPQFVRSSFAKNHDFVDRVVLEYSSQVAISVRYDPGTDMITFDHLVPFHPIYENNYEFYGPDGSFDGLEFSGGIWNYRDDIDARNID